MLQREREQQKREGEQRQQIEHLRTVCERIRFHSEFHVRHEFRLDAIDEFNRTFAATTVKNNGSIDDDEKEKAKNNDGTGINE